MNGQVPNRLEYPIRVIQKGDFLLLDEIVDNYKTRDGRISFDPSSERHVQEGFAVMQMKTLRNFLDRAREIGNLEPLASIVYFLLPSGVAVGSEYIQCLSLPYQQHIDSVMRELSQNIRFQVQITPDNIWGDMILRNGILLMKSGGNYIAYRYSIGGDSANRVIFERLPDSNLPDLETTIGKFHNPKSMESVVLARSRKPYHIKEDMLPYFAYKLTGLKR